MKRLLLATVMVLIVNMAVVHAQKLPPTPHHSPLACCHELLGDVNDDGVVNIIDFSIVATHWETCVGDANYNAAADIDCNGCIEQRDFEILKIMYGARLDGRNKK